jgi:hypothetical protein
MIEGRLEGRHSTDYPAWRSSSASNICGRDEQEAEKCFFLTTAATEQYFSSVSLLACLTAESSKHGTASQLVRGLFTRHSKVRNSRSLLKSRALAVITVIPKRPALIAISASLVSRPFPISS